VVLTASLGGSRLLARPGERRLHLLDPPAAALWDLYASGLDTADLAGLLGERFGLATDLVRIQVAGLIDEWRLAGLLGQAGETPPAWRLGHPDEPVWPALHPRPWPHHARRLRVADRTVALEPAASFLLTRRLGTCLPAARARGPVDHRVRLHGTPTAWRLTLDGTLQDEGRSPEAALVAVFTTLTELGCRPAERLLVVHGAGLVEPDGRGLLLVAPGGSGKSTLAAALDATGFGLLSDDVVPVTLEGELLGLGLPLCLKAGSWPVLAAPRPELAQAPTVQRYGQPVRYLPARTPAAGRRVRPARLVLSRWRPEAPLQAVPLTPEQALHGLLAAEAVIRDLTQTKLSSLAHWIEGLPAWRLTYPDLDAARAWLCRPPLGTVQQPVAQCPRQSRVTRR
jgi:hypothetical protein